MQRLNCYSFSKQITMKQLVIIGLLLFGTFTSFSSDLPKENKTVESIEVKPLKKIDITIKSGPYTIRIRGEVNFNPFTGNVTIQGTISIIGPSVDMELPITYNGPLKKGPNKPIYTVFEIENQDFETVDMVMSRLYLGDPKNVYFK